MYRRALDALDERHGLQRSPLTVLFPGVPRASDKGQIDAVAATILYWQRVGDLEVP